MANNKEISVGFNYSGVTIYAIVKRVSDGAYLDYSTGFFVASPVNPYNPMTEDAVMKGEYYFNESRQVWVNGEYVAHEYKQIGVSPNPAVDMGVGYLDAWINNDQWAQIESPITSIQPVVLQAPPATGTYSAQDIITQSFGMLGIGQGEELDATRMIAPALPILNQVISKYAVAGLLIQSEIDEAFNLTPNVFQYQIGSSLTPSPSAFVTSRPWKINEAYLIDQQNFHYDIELLTRYQYTTITDATQSLSMPCALYYDIGATQTSEIGNIFLYYVPDFSNTYVLHIVSVKQLSMFVNVTDICSFDIAYIDLLVTKLAKRLASIYGKTISDELKEEDRVNSKIWNIQNYRNPEFAKRSTGGYSMNIYTRQINQ